MKGFVPFFVVYLKVYLSVCSYDYQTLDYDIMLIKLFEPVEVNDAVKPIPLPTGCPMGGLPCSVSGWGNTATGEEGQFYSYILSKLYMTYNNQN